MSIVWILGLYVLKLISGRSIDVPKVLGVRYVWQTKEREVKAMYDIFNPMDGHTRFRVPFRWLARLMTKGKPLDYAKHGDGWIA